MVVKAYTDTARDNYGHLPTLAEWIMAASEASPLTTAANRMRESEERLRLAYAALVALPPGDNPYADCTIRVGYHPTTDSPLFIRKVEKGYIHIAYCVDAL